MTEPRWKTIDRGKLQAEVDRLSAEIDAITPQAGRTRDVGLAVRVSSLTATHNALMTVLNCLD